MHFLVFVGGVENASAYVEVAQYDCLHDEKGQNTPRRWSNAVFP